MSRSAAARVVAWAAFAAVVALHLWALYWPFPPGPPPTVPHLDKLVHLLLFASVLWAGRACRLPAFPLAVALLLHAPISEVVQHVALPSREGDVLDLVADAVGVLVALLVPSVRRRAHLPSPPSA